MYIDLHVRTTYFLIHSSKVLVLNMNSSTENFQGLQIFQLKSTKISGYGMLQLSRGQWAFSGLLTHPVQHLDKAGTESNYTL